MKAAGARVGAVDTVGSAVDSVDPVGSIALEDLAPDLYPRCKQEQNRSDEQGQDQKDQIDRQILMSDILTLAKIF
jgi:hypothetical protein